MISISDVISMLNDEFDSIDPCFTNPKTTLGERLDSINSEFYDLRRKAKYGPDGPATRVYQSQHLATIICMLILTLEAELAKEVD